MKRVVKSSHKVLGVEATGLAPLSLESHDQPLFLCPDLIRPSGEWEASAFMYCLGNQNGQGISLGAPANIAIRDYGTIIVQVYDELRPQYAQLVASYKELSIMPFLCYWAEWAGKFRLPYTEREFQRMKKHTEFVCHYFSEWLASVACTTWGLRHGGKDPKKFFKKWFLQKVHAYIVEDYRVNLGNHDLFYFVKNYFRYEKAECEV